MSSVHDIPPEILHGILRLAAQFDHPDALESPLIDWTSKTAILFERGSTLRAQSLATKAALIRVCRKWNAIASPFLYEHIWISHRRHLDNLLVALDSSRELRAEAGSLVKRLDVELFEAPAILNPSEEPVSRLLSHLTNLGTLVMGIDHMYHADRILDSIPQGLSHLYWKHVTLSVPSLFPTIDLINFSLFLEKQASLETMSFPFAIRTWPVPSFNGPYPSPCDWIIQDQSHIVAFNLFQDEDLLPNVCSRSLSYQLESGGMEIVILASGAFRQTDPGTSLSIIDSLEKNPTITRFSLVETFENPWPSHSLARKLRIIERQSPNIRQLDLTLLSDSAELFVTSFYRSTYPIPRLPGVTTLSLQRVFAGSHLLDPVGTLHHLLKIPLWTDAFPSLKTIRLLEDVDFGAAKTCPTLAFTKEKGWGIRVEDRFGELLLS